MGPGGEVSATGRNAGDAGESGAPPVLVAGGGGGGVVVPWRAASASILPAGRGGARVPAAVSDAGASGAAALVRPPSVDTTEGPRVCTWRPDVTRPPAPDPIPPPAPSCASMAALSWRNPLARPRARAGCCSCSNSLSGSSGTGYSWTRRRKPWMTPKATNRLSSMRSWRSLWVVHRSRTEPPPWNDAYS